ncbi:MAG: hypothetical protein L0F96_03415 [Lactococcus lactis]|nr:hypothetical protein [Lactococcus lactis]
MDGKLDLRDFKIVVLIAVIILMTITGIGINSKIKEKAYDDLEVYRKAIKLEDDKGLFDYVVDTQQGNFIINTEIKPRVNQKFSEIDKKTGQEFISLVRDEYKETYDMKTRTVTVSAGKGKTSTKTVVYWEWTWHHIDKQTITSDAVQVYKRDFKTNTFGFSYDDLDASKLITSANRSDYYTGPHHRFSYSGILAGKYTIFAKAVKGSISAVSKGKIETYQKNVKEVLRDQENNPKMVSLIFIISWSVLSIGVVAATGIFLYKEK